MKINAIGLVTPFTGALAPFIDEHFDFYNAKITEEQFPRKPGEKALLALTTLGAPAVRTIVLEELKGLCCRPATLREGLGIAEDGYLFARYPHYLMFGDVWQVPRHADVFSPVVFVDGTTLALGLQRVSDIPLDPTIPILIRKL